MVAVSTSYYPKVDTELLELAFARAVAMPEKERSAFVAAWVGKDTSAASRGRAVEKAYAGTKLGDEKVRLELVKKATIADLTKSKDGVLQLALALRPYVKEMEERRERAQGRLALAKPLVIEARRAMQEAPFASDANGTLRVTYGTVRGYRKAADASLFVPFTTLSQVVAKDQKKSPFLVPEPLRRAFEQKRFGPYVDDVLGEVPVDFLADLHITGGNSGSATLNGKGELVGLVFDGNYESMASDWLFVPAITRSIHVDVRYVLWLLDAVFGADHLVREMGVTPRVD